MNERLGIVEERAAQRVAVLATCRVSPSARARIMGTFHYRPVAKEHRIEVDIKAATRTVETTDHVERMRPRPAPVKTRKYVRTQNAAVLNAVAEAFDVTLYALLSPQRPQRLARPRFAAALLLREARHLSFKKIGKTLKRDHTSAMHEVRQAAHLLATDCEWASRYHAAVAILNGTAEPALGVGPI